MRMFVALLVTATIPASGIAQTTADFKGETITINIGYPPGGAPDAYVRVLAKHYGRYIPGNPAIVARNMQGAGGLRAANHLYNVAPRNGTELANFGPSAAMSPRRSASAVSGSAQARRPRSRRCARARRASVAQGLHRSVISMPSC
jgi:tripartite-type tricarboxylate transporter receptor subunit TctC